MKTPFILNDPPCGTERCYYSLRLAGVLARREGKSVQVFLLGDAASGAKRAQKVPQGYYNVEVMLGAVARRGGEIGVCGTCIDARGMAAEELAEGAHRGTLEELADWTAAADRGLVL